MTHFKYIVRLFRRHRGEIVEDMVLTFHTEDEAVERAVADITRDGVLVTTVIGGVEHKAKWLLKAGDLPPECHDE